MKTRAAVAWKAGAPLSIETVDLEGPKAGEVLVEVKATGICHTDYYTLSGADPEGLFPAILGHEGAGVVVDVGPGVKSLRKNDHVIEQMAGAIREFGFRIPIIAKSTGEVVDGHLRLKAALYLGLELRVLHRLTGNPFGRSYQRGFFFQVVGIPHPTLEGGTACQGLEGYDTVQNIQ